MSFDHTGEEVIEMQDAGLIKKNLSGIIDAAIVLALFIGITYKLPESVVSYLDSTQNSWLYLLLLLALYRLISFLFFNGTIGMRICGLIILNNELEKLSVKQKILAAFFILINGVAYYEVCKTV